MSSALPGLPGSSPEGGTGPVASGAFDAFLDDESAVAAGLPVAEALNAHRIHRASWYGDMVGALAVPAAAVSALAEAVTPADLGLRVLVLAGAGQDPDALMLLREARNVLTDTDTVELVGVQLALPATDFPAATMAVLLDALDFSVPAWIEVPSTPDWEETLDVLAADGAENLCLRVGPEVSLDYAARVLRRAVDLDLTFRLEGARGTVRAPGQDGPVGSPGVLNAICGVRAALNGAEVPEITLILAEQDPAPLISAVRRMSDADVAVARAFLVGAGVPDVGRAIEELAALGLVDRGLLDPDLLSHSAYDS
jgi:hypothetical protein